MLTREGCLSRRERLWGTLPEHAAWVLVADPRHVHYFSNFWIDPFSWSSGERAFLILEREGRATLLCDNLAFRSASSPPVIDEEIVGTWYDHAHSIVNRDQMLEELLSRGVERLGTAPGLVEEAVFPLAALKSVINARGSGVDLGTVIRSLRRRKEPDEVALIQKCLRAAEAGHERARQVIGPGISEFDVYLEVQKASLQMADKPSIVYGDFRAVNAARPKLGGLPTSYTLQEGDSFILDFSVVMGGYRGDTTSTICVGVKQDPRFVELFEVCRSALRKGEQTLLSGVAASRVYDGVTAELKTLGYGGLVHHAGHGIGLAHPEPPVLAAESKDQLQEGDIVTLEPGLYVEGIGGIRLEHNYLITAEGCQRLSQHALAL